MPKHIFTIYILAAFMILRSSGLSAQDFHTPISGHLYGQAIVACTSGSPFDYAATGTSIYARPESPSDYYTPVWTVPGALHISSFNVQHKNGNDYHAILLHDGSSHYYVAFSKIMLSAPDSTITGPVLLPPPYSGQYSKIAAGGKGIYVYSVQAGGPPGNITVSLDNGLTWQPDTIGIGYDAVYDLAPDTAGNMVIAGASGIYKHLPNDSVWTLLNANTYNAQKIYVDHLGRILISDYGIDTHISLDGGASFIADNTGISWQVKYLTGDAYGNLYAISNSIYRNTGGTGTWVSISSGFGAVSGSSATITCMSGDSLLTIGASTGMFTSTDSGTTWAMTNNGILAEDIYSIITQPNGRLVCTSDLGIFYKDAIDTLWHPAALVTPFYPGTELFNDPAGNIFVAVSPTFAPPYPLGRSTDNGAHFTVDSNGISAIGGGAFYMDENGNRYFYNYYATATDPLTVWTSPFGTSTWALDTMGMPVFPTFGLGVKDMHSDRRGFLYASVSLPAGVVLYRRPIAGTAWTVDTIGLGASAIISPMASDPSLGLIAASGSDCFHRAAGTWVAMSPVPGTTANGGINALSVDKHGIIFLSYANYGTPDSNAVYYSSDTGLTWHFAGLAGINANSLVSTGDTTYALTYGNWGYVYDGLTTGIVPIQAADANRIKVYPNPSLAGTWTIQTDNEWIGSRLELTDVDGRIVYRGQINSTSTKINATGIAPGLYMLHISHDTAGMNTWLVK